MIIVQRPDGVQMDVSDKPEVLDLLAELNGDEEDLAEEVWDPHVVYLTEEVTFSLRGRGWRFVTAEVDEQGNTNITLGR